MRKAQQATILVVEDEPAQMELLTYNLGKDGYKVLSASDGEEGLLVAKEQSLDLIILDWMLPRLSGIEVCRQLKYHKHTKDVPVVMLTARGEESDKIRGLDLGADDYVVKPYSVAELLARARALIRRSNSARGTGIVTHGDITINAEQHKASRSGKMVKLGPTEFRLLAVLISRPGRVWSRDQLLERIWDHDLEVDYRTVDVHVGRLRKALKQEGKPDPIRTVRSVGYSLDFIE